ncbi:MAG: hypothetical protein ABEL76_11565 [Bradymonadaceae bacterium]
MNRRSAAAAILAGSLLLTAGCDRSGRSGEQPARSGSAATAAENRPEEQAASSGRTSVDSGPWFYVRSIGGKGDEPGQFDAPVGLAVADDGTLYVSDTGNERLQTVSADGQPLDVWAEGIGRPMHLSLTDGGRLLVPVFLDDEIRIYDGPAEPVDRFGGDWVDAPAGVVQGPDGNYYVADFYNHRFHVVPPEGDVTRTVGGKGKDAGRFTYPTDIEVTPGGAVWVADAYAHRLQLFSPDGTHRRTVGGRGDTEPGTFHVATGIDLGPEGRLYVADFKNHRVQVLRPSGEPVAVIEGGEEGDSAMTQPTDVVATGEKLYVVDHGHDQIDVYRGSGD